MIKVAIFTATRWECNAVRRAFTVDHVSTNASGRCVIGKSGRANIFLFRTGVGPQKASQMCHVALAGQEWDLVVSSGFAGGLSSAPVGSIVVADHVLMDSSNQVSDQSAVPIACDVGFRDQALRVGRTIDHNTQVGLIVTVQNIICRAVEKQTLTERTGAIALDMEGAAVGQAAASHGIPFMMVRTLSDVRDEDLPVDFNVFLRPWGWIRGLATVFATPRCWGGFVRMRSQMIQASRQITKFFEEFLVQIGQPDKRRVRESSIG